MAMIKNKSKNLFDNSKIENGGISSINGEENTSTTRLRTPYITLKSGIYTIKTRDNYLVVNGFVYDFNKNYINTSNILFSSNVNQQTITINVLYDCLIRFSFSNAINTLNITTTEIKGYTQLELGSTATAYVPYNDIQVSVGQFEQAVLTDRFLSVHNPASNDIPIPALNNKTLNEVFDRSILTDITALPNGVKYYEVSGGNVVQRVQERVLLSSDIDIVQNVSGIVQARVLNGVVINGTYNTIDGKTILNGYIETATRNTVAPFDKYLHSETAFGIFNALYVGFPSGTTLTQARDALTGTQVLYQLATPITIVSGVSITQQDLDNYYQAWQRNNAGTLLANTFIQHDQNSVPIADLNGKTLDEVFIGLTYTYGMSISGVSASADVVDFWYSVWQQNHKLGMRVHRASGNDIPLAVLNNQSLNQVFNSNLVVNGDFSNGFNNWTFAGSTSGSSVIDGVANLVFTGSGRLRQTTNAPIGNNYYVYGEFELISYTSGTAPRFIFSGFELNLGTTPFSFTPFSFILTNSTSNNLSIGRFATENWIMNVDNILLIDLTTLGIATLTKSQLDYLYQVWQFNQVNALVARQFIQEA
jgi:hypothetical protein